MNPSQPLVPAPPNDLQLDEFFVAANDNVAAAMRDSSLTECICLRFQSPHGASSSPSRDTPPRLSDKRPLHRHHQLMTGSNAGKKRNRLPTGAVPWKGRLTLDSGVGAAIERAAELSGDLAPSLYMQLLLSQIIETDEQGHPVLPVMNPQLRSTREAHSTAAA